MVGRVRIDQANALRHDKPARRVIKHMTYGFRDTNCFFLEIKAAFPGNVR